MQSICVSPSKQYCYVQKFPSCYYNEPTQNKSIIRIEQYYRAYVLICWLTIEKSILQICIIHSID